jgi:hypothetical protein
MEIKCDDLAALLQKSADYEAASKRMQVRSSGIPRLTKIDQILSSRQEVEATQRNEIANTLQLQ